VPVMIGGVYDEGTLFVDPTLSAAVYPFAIRSLAPGGFNTTAIEAAYPLSSYAVPAQGFARAMGDALYACGNSARRDALSQWVPVFGYEFKDPTLSSTANRSAFYYGTAHGMDSYYLADIVDELPTYPYVDANAIAQEPDGLAKREALGGQISTYFANFVKTGDPNGDGTGVPLAWPRFTGAANRSLINFTLPAITTSVNEFEQAHHCDTLWGPAVFPSIY